MFHKPASRPITRRDALRNMGCGFGYLSLASLVGESLARAESSSNRASWMITDKPKAKHVIFLFMNGGLSQIDSFDYKPALEKYNGQPMPGGASVARAQDRQPDEVALHVQKIRQERHRSQRDLSESRRVRRRYVHRAGRSTPRFPITSRLSR